MPAADTNREDGIQVLRRAAAALDEIAAEPGRLRQVDLENRLGLAKSTVRRILLALTDIGYAAVDEAGRFGLGDRLLGLTGSDNAHLVAAFRPTLQRIADATGETVDLSVLHGREMWFIDQVESRHRLRAVSAVGVRFPVGGTANGKAAIAVLAGSGNEVAFDLDEHTPGISAAGIAGRTPGGQIVAISVPAPSERFNANRSVIVAALLSAGAPFTP
ncbi:helix-turn-helix domain-containing protein [Mycolicibacterium sp. 120266]|uniref:IclR family transcriptional regulator n=1 Tax=Mycolicibacterium sp. 120266 TaxID=3090601 RepID=UPI00299E4D48|nr:helix-turn-helix domain-containing protein [Mycolicibacterium sp. 120266]MDX1872246.1 helix-turn-helix domain-containing protein [Mycolicibacterium sp. 120266]